MRQSLLVLIGTILLVSGGCSAATKPSAVSAGSLEKKVSDVLTKKVGQKPDDVSCPKNLQAKKGATVRCVLTAGSDKLGLTVTTKSVDDDGKINFIVEVDQEMMD